MGKVSGASLNIVMQWQPVTSYSQFLYLQVHVVLINNHVSCQSVLEQDHVSHWGQPCQRDAWNMNVIYPIPVLAPADNSAQSSLFILGQG